MSVAKRILVTGGAGFIGSCLCERRVSLGNDVLRVDNFFSSSRRNVAHLMDDKLFELMRRDVTFPLHVGDWADQHRQSWRVLHSRAGRVGRRTDGLEVEARLPSAAGGRSQAAAAGHLSR